MILAMLACAGSGDGGESATPSPEPGSFADVSALFAASCATAGCHDGPERQTGLDLSAGAAWAQLVSVPARQAPAVLRVAPGDPEGSYLVHKLRGTPSAVGGSGDVMPPGFGLPDDDVGRVEAWIAAGAPAE